MPARIALFAAVLLALGASLTAARQSTAAPATKTESPHSLQEVMQQLAQNTETIQLGLLMNNRLLIEQGATAVANHPKPKGGIAPFLKDKTQHKAVVRSLDQLVHKTARDIAAKAKTAPMRELAKMNAAMIEGCIGCHDVFRN